MKLTVIILTLFTQICLGQEIEIDSCGVDRSSKLNKYEVQYFNQTLEKQRKRSHFDFQEKRIGFAYGNFGKRLITKKEYFDRWGKNYYKDNSQVVDQLIILTEKEKEESEGYDAIIVSWSKFLVSGKQKERLIKKLKERNSS